MIPILLLTFCLGIATAAPTFDHNLDAQWRQWKIKYGKIYRPYVETYKREVWEKNMKIIEQHNKEYREGKHSYTLGMNAFGDMTLQEYNKVLTGFQSQKLENGKVFQKTVFGDVPKFLDWSTKGYVNPVRDQGPCGSCWAFSASGALEGQLFRKTGKLISLSVQNLVDCSRPQGNLGCQGGLMPHAFQYIKDNGGLDTEKSYPYEAREGPCRYRPENSAINVTGFVQIPVDEKVLMNAVATVGPISVGVDANHVKFQFYKSGIYYNPDCSSIKLDHAVLAVGYGFEGKESHGSKYWFIKNSWGTSWGMNGYMKLAKDRNNHCGIARDASYPIL